MLSFALKLSRDSNINFDLMHDLWNINILLKYCYFGWSFENIWNGDLDLVFYFTLWVLIHWNIILNILYCYTMQIFIYDINLSFIRWDILHYSKIKCIFKNFKLFVTLKLNQSYKTHYLSYLTSNIYLPQAILYI